MIWPLLFFAIVLLIVDILLILGWKFNFKENTHTVTSWLMVTIMVAARNEEENIEDCLKSLVGLDYPLDKLEILVGDDGSTDLTAEKVRDFTIKYEHIKLFPIEKQITSGNGKANVLAQLAKKAEGDVFLVTDADILVPAQWVKAMLSGLNNHIGLVTGTSVVAGKGWLALMQRIDWLQATGMLKVVSDLNIPVTTMGNNMLVTREAYEAVGGYENLPFSVTEDLELFNHIKKKFKTVNLFNADVNNRSKPQKTLTELFKQRKRWMWGAFELPILMIILLILQSSFIVLLILLLFINPLIALLVLLLKFTLRYIFLAMVARKIQEKVDLISSFVFEIFNMGFSFFSVLFYLFSGPIVWKERKY